MIDIFVRMAPRHPLRNFIAGAVATRWLEEPDVYVHFLFMKGTENPELFPFLWEVTLPETDFCWTTRNYAEERAQGEFYILADCDHLIIGENWAKRMVEDLRSKPDYGLLSARSIVGFERMEHSDFTGCPCVIRKGVVDFKRLDGPPDKQDEITCRAFHAKGFMTGFAPLDYNHLASGFSQVNPKLWNRY
jgi:hypothetical protein